MGKFDGKVALVVVAGAESGIGHAMAKEFHNEGAKIVVFGGEEPRLKDILANIDNDGTMVMGNIANTPDLEMLFQKIKEAHGKLDFLIVNAGITKLKPFLEVDDQFFIEHFIVNAKGAFFSINKAVPLMTEGGSIIITSSIAALRGFTGASVYGPSKAAVRTMVKILASELAPMNIRINSISPGPVEALFDDMEGDKEALKQEYIGKVPLKRAGTPEEIAKLGVFLASEDAAFITGDDIVIDGGLSQI